MGATTTLPAGSRTNPDSATGSDADLLAGILFDEDAPEVTATGGNRKGREPLPMDPTVTAALNAMLNGKKNNKPNQKARFSGTNAEFRSKCKGTAAKWITQVRNDQGLVVKVHFDTVSGKLSPKKEDNNKPVVVGYRVTIEKPSESTQADSVK